jgi:ribosomal protein S18 acetylase RimI-like enzyme
METCTTGLREASVSDAGAIARVYLETARTQYRGIVIDPALSRLSVTRLTSRWESLLITRRWVRSAHVVEYEGCVVGFVGAGPVRWAGHPHLGEIYAIYVLPTVQRRGLGRRLFDCAVRTLGAAGFDAFVVQVFANNPARGFFEALGGQWAGPSLSPPRRAKVVYRWELLTSSR